MTDKHLLPSEPERKSEKAKAPIVTRDVDGKPVANSRDVAAYFGKEHYNVLKAIDALVREAPTAAVNFNGSSYKDPTGRTLRSFDMDRDGFTLLAMGFTGPKALGFKMAYIAEFNAMEAELSQPAVDPMQVLNDPASMRGLLLTYSEKVLALEAKVEEQGEKVAALDRIAESDGSFCITNAAKTLQVRPRDLFDYLRAHNWIYRRAGTAHDIGYQARVNAGDLEHKVTTVLRADGTEKVVEQVRITPRGLAKLAKLMSPAAKAA